MRLSLSVLISGFVLVLATSLTGCTQSHSVTSGDAASAENAQTTTTSDSDAQTVNQVCPIMGGKVTSDGGTTEWKDQRIGFCCPGCEPEWNELSDAEKSAKLAEATGKGAAKARSSDNS